MEPLLRYTLTIDGPAATVRALLDAAMAENLIVKLSKDESAHPDAADAWLERFTDEAIDNDAAAQAAEMVEAFASPVLLAPSTAPPVTGGRRKLTGLDLYVGMRVKLRATNAQTPPGVPLGTAGNVVQVHASGKTRSSATVRFDNGVTGRVKGSYMRLLG